jgi:hypothetical protein
MRSAGLARLRSLICSLIYSTYIGIKCPKVQAQASECYRSCCRGFRVSSFGWTPEIGLRAEDVRQPGGAQPGMLAQAPVVVDRDLLPGVGVAAVGDPAGVLAAGEPDAGVAAVAQRLDRRGAAPAQRLFRRSGLPVRVIKSKRGWMLSYVCAGGWLTLLLSLVPV